MRHSPALLFFVIAACGGTDPSVQDAAMAPGAADAGNGSDARASANADAATPTTTATDFSQPGPHAVSTSNSSTTVNGCNLSYTLYTPAAGDLSALVVLGHGFQRGSAQMAELGEHIASYGVRVATPAFCHSSFIDTDHAQNGSDAAALATELANGQSVVFAGHSAGGLAAVVAAAENDDAVAVLGLDLVDAQNLASTTADGLSLPIFGIVGESDSCNSNGNSVPIFSGSDRFGIRILGANHCDFEGPTTGTCTAFCGAQTAAPTTVRALSAAFVSYQLGLDASGQGWVTASGSELQELIADGVVTPL